MCSPCEQDCPSRRPNPAPRPGERLGTGGLQVADDQFHLAFEVDGADGARGQQVASLVDGVAADGAFAVDDRQAHEGPALVEGLAAVDAHAIDGVAGVGLELGHAVHLGRGHRAVGRSLSIKVDAVEALLNVQRAQVAVSAGTVVVVQTIRHVARLLRLQNERAGLDGVHGTGINLEKVALVNRQHQYDLKSGTPPQL